MGGLTNRGAYRQQLLFFPNQSEPTTYYAVLLESTRSAEATTVSTSGTTATFSGAHNLGEDEIVELAGGAQAGEYRQVSSVTSATVVELDAAFSADQTNTAWVSVTGGPTRNTNTMADLTEIPAGNGYTAGGDAVARNTADFLTVIENDTLNTSVVTMADRIWTASGGNLPASGPGASHIALTDDNATPANRDVIWWGYLGAERTVSDGQPLTITNMQLTSLQTA